MLPPMHKRDELPKNCEGKPRAAFNIPFLGVWYTPRTRPWVMVQEKWEWWYWTISILLVLPAIVSFLFYRAAIEVHTHGLMHRSWCRHMGLLMKYPTHLERARNKAISHARAMKRHYPYLRRSTYWTPEMIASRLMKYPDES